jgi:hypothetical protein
VKLRTIPSERSWEMYIVVKYSSSNLATGFWDGKDWVLLKKDAKQYADMLQARSEIRMKGYKIAPDQMFDGSTCRVQLI